MAVACNFLEKVHRLHVTAQRGAQPRLRLHRIPANSWQRREPPPAATPRRAVACMAVYRGLIEVAVSHRVGGVCGLHKAELTSFHFGGPSTTTQKKGLFKRLVIGQSSSSSSSDDHQTRRRHSMKIVHGVLNYDTESRIIMTT
jgi:hypothetical protein